MAKILVVDDVRFILEMVASIFRDQGHDVFTADNGAAALETARREGPELVLLDIAMPGMDGVEVATRLREDPRTATTPILMVTSQSDKKSIARAAHAGANDYLAKPFEPAVLLAKAAQLLGGFRMNFSVQSVRGVPVVSVLRPDIDQGVAGEMEEALKTAAAVKGAFVLDFSRVTKIDQGAADAVLRHAEERRREGRPIRVVQPGRGIGTRTLAVRLEPHVRMHDSRDDALADAGATPASLEVPAPAEPAAPVATAPVVRPGCMVDSLGSVVMVRVRGSLTDVLADVQAQVFPVAGRTVLLTASIGPGEVAALSDLAMVLRSAGRVLKVVNADADTVRTLEGAGFADLLAENGATRASS
ncbi:MAG: response regulator [Candidatus Eiseniibacteriota bacterium]